MRYLGIDYGSKRIGLAVGSDETGIAFPKEILRNVGLDTIREIGEYCKAQGINAIVLGQSLDYKGNPNPVQSEIEKFKLEIEKLARLPVYYQRETLTSVQAARNTNTKNLDAAAAALILQSYLDTASGK